MVLEAEVAPSAQERFEARYLKATGESVSPGNPKQYQSQPNKWGMELRMYFNDPDFEVRLSRRGMNIERNRSGYMSGKYKFRVSDNDYWWQLVEGRGLRLGEN